MYIYVHARERSAKTSRAVIGRLGFCEVSDSVCEVLNSFEGSSIFFVLHLKFPDLLEQSFDLVISGGDCRDRFFIELLVVRLLLGNDNFGFLTTGFLSAARACFDDFVGYGVKFTDEMPSSAGLFLIWIPFGSSAL